jgi:hypothetical protein
MHMQYFDLIDFYRREFLRRGITRESIAFTQTGYISAACQTELLLMNADPKPNSSILLEFFGANVSHQAVGENKPVIKCQFKITIIRFCFTVNQSFGSLPPTLIS